MRWLASLANTPDWELCLPDAEQTFVQSELEAEAFLCLPQGCGEMSSMAVCLNRSLHGVCYASRTMYVLLFTRIKIEECLADTDILR